MSVGRLCPCDVHSLPQGIQHLAPGILQGTLFCPIIELVIHSNHDGHHSLAKDAPLVARI